MADAAVHRPRELGVIGTIVLVSLLALGVSASRASAAPLSMTFTEARANVGVQLSDAALFAAPAVAPFEAQIDPGSGSITAGNLQVPQFSTHITDPLDADVTVDFAIGIITGSFTQASGALTLAGEAGGTLTAEGKKCTVSTVPQILVLTTAGNSGGTNPRAGVPFTSGLAGPGAIAGQWTDMTAEPAIPGVGIAVCETVDERIGGPGGIRLEQKGQVVPPPPPACVVPELVGLKLKAAKKKIKAAGCKVGKIHKPIWRKGMGRWVLVVKSSNPAAGASPANGKVNLKLGPKPQRKAHRS